MGQILLTPEEQEYHRELGYRNYMKRKDKNPESALEDIRKACMEAIAKAQLKKVMTDAPWKIGIGIRFLSEEEYQDLLEEAGLEG